MRGVLFSILLTFAAVAASPAKTAASSPAKSSAVSAPVIFAVEAQAADKTVDINISTQGGRRWYANPLWIAIGAIGAVVVLMLIVMAARGGGGGTTVVKG